MNSYPWTRLPETDPDLWNHVRNYMLGEETRLGLKYHNFDHVLSIYSYLHHRNIPYSMFLDIAVLIHDAVFDSSQFKEYRSSIFFFQYLKSLPGNSWFSLEEYEKHSPIHHIVMATNGHSLKECHEKVSTLWPNDPATQVSVYADMNYMIMGDLHQLTNPITAIRNYSLILEESMNLYKVDEVNFARANIKYMSQLSQTIMGNMYRNKNDGHFYKDVSDGIDLTITMSEDIEGIYA